MANTEIKGIDFPDLVGMEFKSLDVFAIQNGVLTPIPFQFEDINDRGSTYFIKGRVPPKGTLGIVDEHDLEHWVSVIAKTRFGDLDLDGRVDFGDFLTLSANFGTSDVRYSDGDLNGDQRIDFADFLLLSANFGKK